MAISKALILASFFLFAVVIHHVEATQTGTKTTNSASYNNNPIPKIDCGGACEARCILSSRPRLCKRACGTCCQRCNCVPSGTSGNLDQCACYAQMTTHDNKRKCP